MMQNILSMPLKYKNIPFDRFGFGETEKISDDLAYHVSMKANMISDHEVMGDSIWSAISKYYECDLNVLKNGGEDAKLLIKNMFASSLTHGFMNGRAQNEALRADESSRLHIALVTIDRLHRLCEMLGVAGFSSYEHGQTEVLLENFEEIIDSIESVVGFNIDPPGLRGGLYGLCSRRGLFCDRHFSAIYVVWRIKRLGVTSMCEIGPGAGFVPYYALKAGMKVATMDLPVPSLVQYTLLANEYSNDQFTQVPVDDVGLVDFSKFDAVVNVDSFPEMPVPVAENYLHFVSRAGMLFSINQESSHPNGSTRQGVVRNMARKLGYDTLLRYPHWLRSGYVEEIFQHPLRSPRPLFYSPLFDR